jgi:hypothetical protein
VTRARLGAGALVAAALAVGAAITTHTPDTDARERPFVRAGVVGKPVDARTFDATVISVRGAAKLAGGRKLASVPARVRDTAGVFVLVRVRLVARDRPTLVDHAVVRDARGRTFVATPRIGQPVVGHHILQPGIPIEGDVVFEVPRDAAARLTLRLADELNPRLDAVAEVPLSLAPSIDQAVVQRWIADPAPAVIAEAEVVAP